MSKLECMKDISVSPVFEKLNHPLEKFHVYFAITLEFSDIYILSNSVRSFESVCRRMDRVKLEMRKKALSLVHILKFVHNL